MSPIIGSFTGSISFNRAAAPGAAIVATGGTITEWNGWRIHTFKTTGANTFEIESAPPGSTIDFIIVGGGGPGGNGLAGGGGGGGVIERTSYTAEQGTYTLNVANTSIQLGDRTRSGLPNDRGNDSSMTTPGGTVLTALGGGTGGYWNGVVGTPGGSGGGAAGGTSNSNRTRVQGGAGTAGQGMPGGRGIRYPEFDGGSDPNNHNAGGGGGAGGTGLQANSSNGGWGGNNNNGSADGGIGFYTTIDGTPRYFGGGGGGSCWKGSNWCGNGGLGGGGGSNYRNNSGIVGSGGGSSFGNGGGGNSTQNNNGQGGSGAPNTGGGGGGSFGNAWGGGPGGSGGSGCVIIRYRYQSQVESGLSGGNLGLTEATAAESAWAIKQAWSGAPDGTYWIKPSASAPAYKVHCYMTVEGGGWELTYRVDSHDFGPTSGTSVGTAAGGPGWAGWNWTTKAECDSFNTYYERHGDFKTISPSFCYQNFYDVMVIANQRPDLRCGYRFASLMDPCTTQLSTATRKSTNTVLFGSLNWPASLHVRQDTNRGYTGGDFFGFKVNADSHPRSTSTSHTGGNVGSGWGASQIGIGRDNQSGSRWGGGFGYDGYNYGAPAPYSNSSNHMGGHFWGHGDGRNGSAWSGDRSSPFFGHAIYIRRGNP